MNADNPHYQPPRLARATLGLTALAAGALLAFCFLYSRLAPAFLARLDTSVGEMLMEEGMRLEQAGAFENAKERYRLALDSRFEGLQNRAHTLNRLGIRLWLEGNLEDAATYLQQAADSPYAPISVYAPLCDALMKLKRHADARKLLGRWQAAADASGISSYQAEAKFYAGQIAMADGNTEAAMARYREGDAIAPGGRNAAELAYLYYDAGEYEKALVFAERYLKNGGAGSRAAYARQIRAEAQKRLKP